MAVEMAPEQIDQFVESEVIGRIGCHADGRTYVVPITYVYRDGAVYSFSHEGLKMQMMRANPRVCLEIERIESLGEWESVVADTTFEELDGEEADRGAAIILERLMAMAPDPNSRRRLEEAVSAGPKPIVYRLILGERTGRIERPV